MIAVHMNPPDTDTPEDPMAEHHTKAFDEDLNPLLETSSNEDLAPLVQYVVDRGGMFNRLDSNPTFREFYPQHTIYADLIAEELRRFGGHEIANVWRGHGARYADIVRDVADRVKANYHKNAPVATVETAILQKVVENAWDQMDEDQRATLLNELGVKFSRTVPTAFPVMAIQAVLSASGLSAYRLAAIVANSVATALLGHAMGIGARAALTRTLAAFTGPVGWVLTIGWATYDLLGPAYRVTIPCIIHVAMLRQQSLIVTCPKCETYNTQANKFCSHCGTKLHTIDD